MAPHSPSCPSPPSCHSDGHADGFVLTSIFMSSCSAQPMEVRSCFSFCESHGVDIDDDVGDDIDDDVGDDVDDAVGDDVGDDVGAAVDDGVGAAVDDDAAVGDGVGDGVGAAVGAAVSAAGGGYCRG